MPDVKFSVKASSESPTRTVVETRGFTMIVDEPENMGGTDEGPNPVEYVLGALAGCLNVVGHMIAEEMDFKLEDLKISLEGDLDPAKFTGRSDRGRAGYKEIRVKLDAATDADDSTLEKWIGEIEERCPVSDNLSQTTPVKISLK